MYQLLLRIGGLKLWEGSLDLVKSLDSEIQKGNLSFEGKRVLEVGFWFFRWFLSLSSDSASLHDHVHAYIHSSFMRLHIMRVITL